MHQALIVSNTDSMHCTKSETIWSTMINVSIYIFFKSRVTIFWHRTKIVFTPTKHSLQLSTVPHLQNKSVKRSMHYYKKKSKLDKNVHNCHILSQNMFSRHQSPIVIIHCTNFEKNLSRHLCILIKRSCKWTKNVHNCHILA